MILQQFNDIPKSRRYAYFALIAFGVVYLLWLKFGRQPVRPGEIISGQTAAAVKDMDRKVVASKLMVFTPKAEAVRKLGLPPEQSINPDEEIIESTDAPPSQYGTTTTTFVNMSTGLPRSVIKAKETPWFSFERGYTLGAEAGIGSKGRYYQGDVQYDLLQIKGLHIGVKGSVTSYPSETDVRGGVRIEYRGGR